jgi:hypothetical protein
VRWPEPLSVNPRGPSGVRRVISSRERHQRAGSGSTDGRSLTSDCGRAGRRPRLWRGCGWAAGVDRLACGVTDRSTTRIRGAVAGETHTRHRQRPSRRACGAHRTSASQSRAAESRRPRAGRGAPPCGGGRCALRACLQPRDPDEPDGGFAACGRTRRGGRRWVADRATTSAPLDAKRPGWHSRPVATPAIARWLRTLTQLSMGFRHVIVFACPHACQRATHTKPLVRSGRTSDRRLPASSTT